MQERYTQLPWERSGWLEEATSWVHAQLAECGVLITGPLELLHQRPWSTFAQVPTEKGLAYFKAPAPMYGFEAALTRALAHWRPDITVPVLAVDLDRGWLLSADAGITLRSLSRSADQVEHWLKVLPLYVELQVEMADREPELLAMGLPDRRLANLPLLYNQLLDDAENLRVGLDPGLTPDEYQDLRRLRSHFAALCEQLAGFGLPETLVHEEVHENNVLLGEEGYIFTDWSDSCIGHSFFTMLVTLRTVVHWLKVDEDGLEVKRLRDAYLEPWTVFGTRQQLSAAFDLAYRLAMVNRALSWQFDQGALSKKHKEPYADAVPGWLGDFLVAEESARIAN